MKPNGTLIAAILAALAVSCSTQTDRSKASYNDSNAIAVVLGKRITAKEAENCDGLIFAALLARYAKEHKIEATEKELDTFVTNSEEKAEELRKEWVQERAELQAELKTSHLSDQDRKEKEARLHRVERFLEARRETQEGAKGMEKQRRSAKREIARHFVESWNINKALYAKYGGRVIFQQGGPEPLDAYREFLKDEEKKGSFQILNKQYEASFWRYFTNDAMHTFYSKHEGTKFMNTPWWMMEAPED